VFMHNREGAHGLTTPRDSHPSFGKRIHWESSPPIKERARQMLAACRYFALWTNLKQNLKWAGPYFWNFTLGYLPSLRISFQAFPFSRKL